MNLNELNHIYHIYHKLLIIYDLPHRYAYAEF
jgi:hypothetical protein